ncbi:FadR/GntR family transcriptional regulator [Paramaledivibacter caminithermalis]|jgi:GntR family transcriptional repressor for pyruvate dehydrogenase complex|uniref:GntR family transcriptional regulator, transcriptional repressor for pyruvate dehydrogenase complex n=1 Tax=Paramaledivibacter caminithermalis (strain DSM 15212 / CIP 107654 / DViRD3) TaxID=1121301 RepID=A0A1M6RWP5_PARC5|nr:FadR/GntR family transcriptional regulator [Paramaledivibacter caminithermalis]SHK36975.1 GntR family transcriptional regulator, transcriptional repressor for pyruvate dehydrogenase complex [Paramaledivibacter caminithermalis DSM 15212]
MAFKKVQSERLSDKVVNQILNLIERGELKPGDKLPSETEFAKQLGISRGILREALTILQSKGYVSRKPKDGTYIREFFEKKDFQDSILEAFQKASYLDLLEVRETLERKIVELVIKRSSDEELEEIEQSLVQDVDDFNIVADQAFHQKIASLTKNTILTNFMYVYYDMIHDLANKTLKSEDRRKQLMKEHTDILKAIKERDIEKAQACMSYHLGKVKQSVNSLKIDFDN